MQTLKQNIKTGLITLGVLVALLAVLLTPGFFNIGTDGGGFQLKASETREAMAGFALKELAKNSTESVRDLMRKATVK